jgi:hypothetical protein
VRIINGEKLGDLPVQRKPFVNLKATRALDFYRSPMLLARAD